jgi:SSS family solute:Na+ symporter
VLFVPVCEFVVNLLMTHFNWLLDGSIVGVYLLITMIAGLMMRKYVGKVEHFLVAGREMNVYLGIASLAATEFGIVTCMYTAQNGYEKGFAGATPGILMALAMLVVGVTGFCIKPLRDSGVITIPELINKRFGPRIRWAAGVVIVLRPGCEVPGIDDDRAARRRRGLHDPGRYAFGSRD